MSSYEEFVGSDEFNPEVQWTCENIHCPCYELCSHKEDECEFEEYFCPF